MFSDGGNGGSSGGSSTQPTSVVARSAVALQYALLPSGAAAPGAGPGSAATLPLGAGANVTIHRSGPHSVVIAFTAPAGLASAAGGGGEPVPVPFLSRFLAPAEAPAWLVDAFGELLDGDSSTLGALGDVSWAASAHMPPAGLAPGGELSRQIIQRLHPALTPQAVEEVMGGAPLLRVLCTGEGAGGSLALLCGPWAALYFPAADADAITFGADWVRL